MSNIETLRSTEVPVASPATRRRVATTVASVVFTVAIVSLRPFQPDPSAVAGGRGGGDALNQFGFSAFGAVAVVAMLCLADPRKIAALFSPWWLLMLVFLGLGVMNALDPAGALRAVAFTLIGVTVMCAVLVLPPDADSFSKTLAVMSLFVLFLCYAGVVLLPDIAIHSAMSEEPEHAGLWRGSFSHKNLAGPVMACIGFIGFYLYRRGWKWIGAAIFIMATIFLVKAGSKTAAGLVPMAILLVALPNVIGMRRLTVLLLFAVLVVTAVGTLGIVFIAPVKHLAAEYFPGMTYTGRTSLWEFSGEMLAKRPWTGYGYESFWETPLILNTDQPFDRNWDIRNIVHGHNGYLDFAVTLGIPALCILLVLLVVAPARDYLRIPHRRENIFAGDLFMMILFFTLLNAFLETFFFRRIDAVWLFVIFAVVGLRIAARFPMKASTLE